jgi:hypothetical protein
MLKILCRILIKKKKLCTVQRFLKFDNTWIHDIAKSASQPKIVHVSTVAMNSQISMLFIFFFQVCKFFLNLVFALFYFVFLGGVVV